MRVVVTGASRNVGTSVLAAFETHAAEVDLVGVARRVPDQWRSSRVSWVSADVTTDDLAPIFEGADAVVHLAWAIQPSRDETTMRVINVEGSQRVFEAAARSKVGALVYASSVGAYSPGPSHERVTETWPTHGVTASAYSRHKAYVERLLDIFERDHPDLRVVRLRPGLTFKREAASEIRRLFLGPLFPSGLLRPELLAVVPDVGQLSFQVVHSLDVGEAYRLAVMNPVQGAFNIAGEPVLSPDRLARVLGARLIPVPASLLRAAAKVTWQLHLQPTSVGWVDLALACPLMDTTRAHHELGWKPVRSSEDCLLELIEGIRSGSGLPTPALIADATHRTRVHELRTAIGGRQGT